MQIRLPNGLAVDGLNKRDTLAVYRDIFDDSCYAKHVTLNANDVVIDVGANVGIFTLWACSLGRNLKVYAFEPIPVTYACLLVNVSELEMKNVTVANAGVSDHAGECEFTFYPRFTQASTRYPDHSDEMVQMGRQYILDQVKTLPTVLRWATHLIPSRVKNLIAERIRSYYLRGEQVICRLTTVSDIIKDEGIDRIGLLKIDAEGSELDILRGIEGYDWWRIRQLVVEAHGGHVQAAKIAKLLESRSYTVHTEPNPMIPALTLIYAT